jgi:hypothetical protein
MKRKHSSRLLYVAVGLTAVVVMAMVLMEVFRPTESYASPREASVSSAEANQPRVVAAAPRNVRPRRAEDICFAETNWSVLPGSRPQKRALVGLTARWRTMEDDRNEALAGSLSGLCVAEILR